MSPRDWRADRYGVWHRTFGPFRMKVYQHKVDGHRWSAVVFDSPLPELWDTRQAAQAAAETMAWGQLQAALRALKPP